MKKQVLVAIIVVILILTICIESCASSIGAPSNAIQDTITNDSQTDPNFNQDTYNKIVEGNPLDNNGESISTLPAENVIANILTYVVIVIPTSINALLSIAVMSDMPTKEARWFTIESLLSGKFDLFDINFFNIEESTSSINTITKENVAKWFYALRNFAIAALLAVLIYIGILMAISETASDKSKYKKMLTSWFASFVLLFVIQYVLIIAINVSGFFVDVIHEIAENVENTTQKPDTEEKWIDDKYSQADEMEIKLINGYEKEVDGKIEQRPGLLSTVFTNSGWNRLTQAIVYCVLVYYQVKFFFMYLKRFFTVGFLIAVSPLITITYSIDKAGDNKAQAYKTWFKEIIVAIFIQPIHLMFFLIFMASTQEIILRVPILAIFLIGTLSRAELIIRKLFKIDGTNSLGSLKRKRW